MNDFLYELNEILDEGFTGQIILHCNEGTVTKFERRETRRPREGRAYITEDIDFPRTGSE